MEPNTDPVFATAADKNAAQIAEAKAEHDDRAARRAAMDVHLAGQEKRVQAAKAALAEEQSALDELLRQSRLIPA